MARIFRIQDCCLRRHRCGLFFQKEKLFFKRKMHFGTIFDFWLATNLSQALFSLSVVTARFFAKNIHPPFCFSNVIAVALQRQHTTNRIIKRKRMKRPQRDERRNGASVWGVAVVKCSASYGNTSSLRDATLLCVTLSCVLLPVIVRSAFQVFTSAKSYFRSRVPDAHQHCSTQVTECEKARRAAAF